MYACIITLQPELQPSKSLAKITIVALTDTAYSIPPATSSMLATHRERVYGTLSAVGPVSKIAIASPTAKAMTAQA